MNNPWAYALITMGLIAMILARRVPRAWVWLGVGGLSFVTSSLFWDYGGRPDLHPLVTLTCDSLVCLALYKGAREVWELGLFVIFWGSVITSLVMLAGFFQQGWMYAACLEFWNALAMLVIGGVGIVQSISQHDGSLLYTINRRLHSARDSL